MPLNDPAGRQATVGRGRPQLSDHHQGSSSNDAIAVEVLGVATFNEIPNCTTTAPLAVSNTTTPPSFTPLDPPEILRSSTNDSVQNDEYEDRDQMDVESAVASPDDEDSSTPKDAAESKPCSRGKMIIRVVVTLVVILVGAVVAAAVCRTGNCGGGGGGGEVLLTDDVNETGFPRGTATTAPTPLSLPNIQISNSSSPQGLVISSSSSIPTTSPTQAPAKSTLETILSKGMLSCGVLDLPGQSSRAGDRGRRVGFSVDLCRAIAAAIFGTNTTDTLDVVAVEATNRFRMLKEGVVDVLAASVTHTMERDVFEPTTQVGYTFSTPYLYNGMAFAGIPPFLGCADSLNTTVCAKTINVCVLDGSTYVDRVKSLLPNAIVSVSPTTNAFYENFRLGFCNVLAGDQFEVSPTSVQQMGYFGPYEVGSNLYTKEPLAIVTREEDATWSDFVNWVVQGLLAAEEQSFTQDRAKLFTLVPNFGSPFESMLQSALSEVGNYAEMYERNLSPLLPRSDANMINTKSTGLIYAMPFGSMTSSGPNPPVGSTLRRIKDRGFLRCGITRRALFAEFDITSQEWKGLDIDFCKALSAAIFDGVTRTVVYSVLPATDRFIALQERQVDVLSRITTHNLVRDVNETSSGAGFSFSQPNFYDGLSFGGIPPFGTCADRRDTTSGECQNLKICYNAGTTFETILSGLFPARFLVARQSGDLVAEGLAIGVCNAVAGGVVDISSSNILSIGGYTGSYETGTVRFSKDPLALVTRQDDPQWSAFVYWIVSAIFYAEEEGIAASSVSSMPIVNLLGPFNTRIFRDAVGAVGSYKEIYQRNIGSEVARGGLNTLNVNPLSAQHYTLPGL